MPRPNIMRIETTRNKTTTFIERMSRATAKLFRSAASSTPATTRNAGSDQQCSACDLGPTPAPTTPAAFESQDVISAIASQITDKTTLAALSQTDSDQQCSPCDLGPTPAPTTPAALESQDVISAIASQ